MKLTQEEADRFIRGEPFYPMSDEERKNHMIDLEMKEAHETLDGHVLTDEEIKKLFVQTPEDQGLPEDEELPV